MTDDLLSEFNKILDDFEETFEGPQIIDMLLTPERAQEIAENPNVIITTIEGLSGWYRIRRKEKE